MSEPTTNGNGATRRHSLGLLVENRSGVLAKIAGLIAAKGYNIDSLTVAATHDETMSRMTIVLRGDEWVIEQATKQLNRLIEVVKVQDLTDQETVERELILLRVAAEPGHRDEIFRIAEIFRANVIDVTSTTFTLELTGGPEKVEGFIELLRPYQILDLYRTGRVVVRRGAKNGEAVRAARIGGGRNAESTNE